jgi:hypothetical protein
MHNDLMKQHVEPHSNEQESHNANGPLPPELLRKMDA